MNNRKSCLFILTIFFLSVSSLSSGQVANVSEAGKGKVFHVIKSGETLYRITQIYGVSADEICDANPGLGADNFKAGATILIPSAKKTSAPEKMIPVKDASKGNGIAGSDCKEMHKVKRKETIFGIAKKYGLTAEDLMNANPEMKKAGYELKKGNFICIPFPKPAYRIPSDTELFDAAKDKPKSQKEIRAAIILPFKAKTAESTRVIEYYQGILMAADSIRRLGVSLELYAYDSGETEAQIKAILSKPEMKWMDVIFGPLYKAQMSALSAFSLSNGIRVVSPFSSKDEEVFNNPNWVMLNPPSNYENAEVFRRFVSVFGKSNVVFLNKFADGSTLTRGLQAKLNEQSITYSNIPQSFTDTQLKESLSRVSVNVVVLSSDDLTSLNIVVPRIKNFLKNNPEYKLQLFGHPSWQTYVKEHLDSFYELDTYIYTPFYRNPLSHNTARFEKDYLAHFHKAMIKTYPRMSMFGFDSALFFFKGISRYGKSFASQDIFSAPVQNGIKLHRVSNWGGMINNNIWFVHYKPTHKIEISTFK